MALFFSCGGFLLIGVRQTFYHLLLVIFVLTQFVQASCTGVSFDCCAINACPDGGAVDVGYINVFVAAVGRVMICTTKRRRTMP